MRTTPLLQALLVVAATVVWFVYARLVHIGPTGWWSYPGWWPAFLPSYFQLGTVGFTAAFFATLRFIPAPILALAVVAGGMSVFPQNPVTDVAFITASLAGRVIFLALGAAFTAFVPSKLVPLAPLIYVTSISVVLAALTFASDPDGLAGTVIFFFLHFALPAQLSALVLSRWAPTSLKPGAA